MEALETTHLLKIRNNMPSGGFTGITGLCKYSPNHKQTLHFKVKLFLSFILYLFLLQCSVLYCWCSSIFIFPPQILSFTQHTLQPTHERNKPTPQIGIESFSSSFTTSQVRPSASEIADRCQSGKLRYTETGNRQLPS